MDAQCIRYRRRWHVVYDYGSRFVCYRRTGTAHALTPLEAVQWAYADGGKPDVTFRTRREAEAYLAEESHILEG